jgi:protein gp37
LVGCSVISPGCTNCYAMKTAARNAAMNPGLERYQGLTKPSKAGPVWTGKIGIAPEEVLTKPLRWKRPRMIFVNSMSDLFHEAVPDEVIDRIFAVMALAPQHIFQVLTKRAKRMREYVTGYKARSCVEGMKIGQQPTITFERAFAHVWLGVSVEDQTRADERIPDLLDTPAAVRWISAEPLLSAIRFGGVSIDGQRRWDWLTGQTGVMYRDGPDFDDGPKLDWVVAGGESGKGARPMHPDWARSLRDQCAAAGVPFFFKQWGSWCPSDSAGKTTRAINGADWWQGRWQFNPCPPSDDDDRAVGGPQMILVGKARAGRLLDGVEHNAMHAKAPLAKQEGWS